MSMGLTDLARGRHTDGPWPVVIHVSEFVGQLLEDVWFPAGVIKHHVVVCGRDCSLPHMLTHQKEIIPEGKKMNWLHHRAGGPLPHVPASARDGMVHHSAWGRVGEALWPTPAEHACGDSLLHHNHSHLGMVVISESGEAGCHLRDLILRHHMHLTVPHSVSEHHNPCWETPVQLQHRYMRAHTHTQSSLMKSSFAL